MKKYDVIGIMSGTSLDGLDIAMVNFQFDDCWKFDICSYQAIPYDANTIEKLSNAIALSGFELKKLDIDYGTWIGKQVKQFIDRQHVRPDLIVSHGHTVFHQPENGITLQVGDGYEILRSTGIKTISDLRSLDVSLGGQGAPLVPIGDKLLFSEYDHCLNLGGFSNISFDSNEGRIAFDICPVNTVLNLLSNKLDRPFDLDGELAKSGITNSELFDQLNALSYYKERPPKSLGIEWVLKYIIPMLKQDTPENLLNTFCHHIAYQITSSTIDFTKQMAENHKPKMLITGGGAKNTFLIELINKKAKDKFEIVIPDEKIVDYKEAIIFAFLGLLRSLGKINTLKSVTGAQRDSSGGLIFES